MKMKLSKRTIALFLAVVLTLGLTACMQGHTAETPSSDPLSATLTDSLSESVQPLVAEVNRELPFTDIPSDADYLQAVTWCYERNLMQGTSATVFSPNDTLTRAMVVTVLYRAAGQPAAGGTLSFSDTLENQWYSNAVLWASGQNIVQGYGNGLFGTNDLITREQLDMILCRYQGQTPAWTGDPAFNVAVTRAEAAQAFYDNLSQEDSAPDTDSITTNSGESVALAALEHQSADGGATVYYISDITSQAMMSIYEALVWTPTGDVAVKLSTGEPGSNYLDPALIADLVHTVDGTIVECNTAYGGSRASTAMHYQVAEDHGFTAIADVDIMDENGSMTLAVTKGDNLTENYVGVNFANYDSFLVLSHFKGHGMAGFGGAIKNISIGIASSQGKGHIHSGGTGGGMWGGSQDAFLESMAEAGSSVVNALDGQIVYINVMNRLSVDCDCDSNPAEPDMHDIGILASTDPVALDQACVDLVYAVQDGGSLTQRIESRNGIHTLEQAEKIDLGSRSYHLVSLDD